ncbi:hypothetical protein [Calothrix sp. PCC 7507]|uniref:hypothetical protein n=1 Tax=Calothrix sp. PCC 7507 TaxID=99598 RepID=UPI00029F0561|nr:hypothetical protein [Calothrix sp. PCC 7507]AFY32811.1 hypothetical protein Cal7507_2380 [Calothrix sp. PCC 7507]
MDFIALLHQGYVIIECTPESPEFDLINDSFIGMRRHRQDLANNTAWVHSLQGL